MANKTKYIWIGLASATLIGVGLYMWNRNKKSEEGSASESTSDENTGSTTSASDTTNVSNPVVMNDNFPLKVGSRGTNVKNLQKALKITADGIFGRQTKSASESAGLKLPISQEAYNKFIQSKGSPAGTPPQNTPTSSSFKSGDPIYVKGDSVLVYSYPNTSTKYQLGKITKLEALDKPVGTYMERAGNTTFAKVTLRAYADYKKGAVTTPTVAYVKGSDLSNSPF